MIHWPEKLKWIEGKSSKIKYLQGFVRTVSVLADNFFARLSPLPKYGINHTTSSDEKIIISLTSFPERIDKSYYAIKSLMSQSQKADRIILWLAKEQFPDKILPSRFKALLKRGLEVRFTDEDLKSHKKYFYALQEQRPDELIITFDDDIIFESDAIKRLIETHRKFPGYIICNRGVVLEIDEKKQVKRVGGKNLYHNDGVRQPSFLLVPSTGAGTLYPYGVMPESTFNKKEIFESAISSDDLWIWYNGLKAGIGVVKTKKESRVLSEIVGSQFYRLSEFNDEGGENDRVLERFEFLKSETAIARLTGSQPH